MFKVNHDEATTFYVEDGTYEVVVTQAKEGATKNGSEYMDFRLTIRNDVQQKSQNSNIFYKIWKSKETGQYNMGMVQALCKALRVENGKTYASVDALLDDLLGRYMRVTVKNEENEFQGKIFENLNVKRTEETKAPQLNHTFKADELEKIQQARNGGQPAVEVTNDDLPF